MNSFSHNTFSGITASLFNNEEMSNVRFIVSEPPPSTCPLNVYSKATKDVAGLSKNGGGISPDEGVQGGDWPVEQEVAGPLGPPEFKKRGRSISTPI